MKSIARALALFELLPCMVALEGTTQSSAATGDYKSLAATKTKDSNIAAKSPEDELRAEIRKEVQRELSVRDVQREVLVQSSIHNAGTSASMMEQLRKLKAEEQKDHKTAKRLAEANKQLRDHTKRLRSALLQERATVKADSRELEHMKQQQKVTAGTVQNLNKEVRTMQQETAGLKSSLAQEKQLSGNIKAEFSKLQHSDELLTKNFTKLSNTSKMNEQKLKKQGLFLLKEIHNTRGQLSEAQQREHNLELQKKEKEHELASVKESMLQESQRLQTQSQRNLNAANQKLAALEAKFKKEENANIAKLRMDTSSLSKLRRALAESRSEEKMSAKQLETMKMKNKKLMDEQSLMSKNLAGIQLKDKAMMSAKDKELKALNHNAQEQLEHIEGLQAQASRTAAQLQTSTAAETASKAEISTLNKNALVQKAKIMSGLKEIAALQDKLEAQAQSETALARQSLAAQTEAKNELRLKDEQYSELKQKYSLSEKQGSSAAAQVKEQSLQLQRLQNQLTTAQAAARTQINDLQKQMRTVMLSAATKVRVLQEEQEESQKTIKETKAALLQASTEAATQREAVQTANADALKASREERTTETALSASQSAAAAAAAHARMAEETVKELREQVKDKDQLVQKLNERQEEVEELQDKTESLQRKWAKQESALQTAKQRGEQMSERLDELSDVERRSSLLQGQLHSLQKSQSSKDKEIADLKQRHMMLEQLNDHFSQQMDFYANASKTWQSKADKLQEELDERTTELRAALRKRSEAQEVERDSRSEEDVYFEEAQKLQTKYDAQASALEQAYATSNSSAAEVNKLHERVDRLQAEQSRDQRNNHAVWVDVEKELVQAQKKQAWSQAQISQSRLDIMRMEAVLTDEQRKKLGLPPREKESPRNAKQSMR